MFYVNREQLADAGVGALVVLMMGAMVGWLPFVGHGELLAAFGVGYVVTGTVYCAVRFSENWKNALRAGFHGQTLKGVRRRLVVFIVVILGWPIVFAFREGPLLWTWISGSTLEDWGDGRR